MFKDSIASAYQSVENSARAWPLFAYNLPSAIVWHDHYIITESTDVERIHDWVLKTDHDYPVHMGKHITKQRDSHLDSLAHSEWMKTQHEDTLFHKHQLKLTGEDFDNIDNLVYGGLYAGHASGSRDVNDFLWQNHKEKKESPSEFVRTNTSHGDLDGDITLNLNSIDSTIKKNRFEKPLITYHGIGFDPSEILDKNKTIHLPAYTSGSLNRNIAIRYAKANMHNRNIHEMHIIQLKHPQQSTGLYLGNTEAFTDNEVLLPRHMTIRLDTTPDKYQVGEHTVNIWKANRLLATETS